MPSFEEQEEPIEAFNEAAIEFAMAREAPPVLASMPAIVPEETSLPQKEAVSAKEDETEMDEITAYLMKTLSAAKEQGNAEEIGRVERLIEEHKRLLAANMSGSGDA